MYSSRLKQLADDTAIWSESFRSLQAKLRYMYEYAEDNYQHINNVKTKYLHLSSNPVNAPILIDQKNALLREDCPSFTETSFI